MALVAGRVCSTPDVFRVTLDSRKMLKLVGNARKHGHVLEASEYGYYLGTIPEPVILDPDDHWAVRLVELDVFNKIANISRGEKVKLESVQVLFDRTYSVRDSTLVTSAAGSQIIKLFCCGFRSTTFSSYVGLRMRSAHSLRRGYSTDEMEYLQKDRE